MPDAAPTAHPKPHHPSPTQARGVLLEKSSDAVVLGLPETDYQLHLTALREPDLAIGKKIAGVIRLEARRVDVVDTGGRYIEPVYGRPRRVQGDVVAIDHNGRSITVNAAVPIVCKLQKGQSPSEFAVGDFVSFDCMPGASFTQG